MIVSAYQPFLAPFPAFFAKALLCAAEKFLGFETFAAAGLELRTFTNHPEIYPQLYGPFIQNLSAFDLLFTCGPKAPGILRSWLRPLNHLAR